MPRIATIGPDPNQGLSTLKLSQAAQRAGSRGAESGAMIEQGVNELARGIEKAGDIYGVQHEAPKLASERADTEAKIQLGTDDFFKKADPDDPDLTNKYHDWLGKQLDTFGQGTITSTGGRIAGEMRAEMLNHFTTVGLADSAHVAAGASIMAMEKSVNNRTQMVMSDPSQYEYAQRAFLQDYNLQVASHRLTPEQLVTLQNEHLLPGQKAIAVAAMRATAERNPEQLEHDIASGRYTSVVGETEIKEARAYGLANQRAGLEMQKAQEAERRRHEDEQFSGAMSDLYAGMELPNGTMAVPPDYPQQIVKMALLPGAQRHPGEIKSAMEMVQRITNDMRDGKTVVTDPHTYADFSHRMNLHDSDPNALTYAEVNIARANGQLSDRDHAMFRQSIADNQKDPVKRDAYSQFGKQMTANKGVITHSNILSGVVDSPGDQRYAEYLRYERTQFDEHFKKDDWRKWLDDNGPTKDAARFAPGFNPNQDMSKPSPFIAPPQMGGGGPTKRNPDETPDQYLKRIGKE